MYSSTPANFNDEIQLPILQQQRRQKHNMTRKKQSNKLQKIFDELRNNDSKSFEGFSNDNDSDSGSDSETDIIEPKQQHTTKSQPLLAPPQNTQGISQSKVDTPTNILKRNNSGNVRVEQFKEGQNNNTQHNKEHNYTPQQNIFKGVFDNTAPYNENTYNVNKKLWNVSIPTQQPINNNNLGGGIQHADNSIISKLNYAIQLLEEKRDEKTGKVTEELILYGLLGVFIIYAIDSFVRVGEYKR